MKAGTHLAGTLVGGIWKVAAIMLLCAWALTAAGLGANWWLAARDRDIAKVDLKAEQQLSAQYSASIREQNRAVDALEDQKKLAEDRGAAAQLIATANGKRLDLALQRTVGATATTCTEAMATVDTVLEAIR